MAKAKKPLEFGYVLKNFAGFLEGTMKAGNTVSSYRSDLNTFGEYLQKNRGSGKMDLSGVPVGEIESYGAYLRTLGYKRNTRRRKLLTVRRMIRYFVKRNRLGEDFSRVVNAPEKVERIPKTISTSELIEAIKGLPSETDFAGRNRALLWVLAETGCRVSEAARLKGVDFSSKSVRFMGKFPRSVPVSAALSRAVHIIGGRNGWLFCGYNKAGPLTGGPITPRGVELLVKAYASRLGCDNELTPRTFRHSVVLKWHAEGKSKKRMCELLGLRTDYAFRVYDEMLKPRSPATSSP